MPCMRPLPCSINTTALAIFNTHPFLSALTITATCNAHAFPAATPSAFSITTSSYACPFTTAAPSAISTAATSNAHPSPTAAPSAISTTATLLTSRSAPAASPHQTTSTLTNSTPFGAMARSTCSAFATTSADAPRSASTFVAFAALARATESTHGVGVPEAGVTNINTAYLPLSAITAITTHYPTQGSVQEPKPIAVELITPAVAFSTPLATAGSLGSLATCNASQATARAIASTSTA